MVCIVSLFLFFKQKTAYEMRISDWSSDVCSSDLRLLHLGGDERAALPVGQPVDRANVGALAQPEADDVRRVPLGLGAQPRMVRTVEGDDRGAAGLEPLENLALGVRDRFFAAAIFHMLGGAGVDDGDMRADHTRVRGE